MTKYQKISLFLVRVSMGWLFLYAGIVKVINPAWSAEGYIKGAKNFMSFYNVLLNTNILPFINFINEWGLVLLGVSLILGIGVRLSAVLGATLMLLYYFVVLDFPYPNPNSFLIDEHIIYALVLILLAKFSAGRILGLAGWCSNLPIFSKFKVIKNLID